MCKRCTWKDARSERKWWRREREAGFWCGEDRVSCCADWQRTMLETLVSAWSFFYSKGQAEVESHPKWRIWVCAFLHITHFHTSYGRKTAIDTPKTSLKIPYKASCEASILLFRTNDTVYFFPSFFQISLHIKRQRQNKQIITKPIFHSNLPSSFSSLS